MSTQVFTIMVQRHDRDPVMPEDRETALLGLSQEAAKQSCVLTQTPWLVDVDYDPAGGLYTARYQAPGRSKDDDPALWRIRRVWPLPGPAKPARPVYRPGRSPRHLFRVIGDHIERALTERTVEAVAVALHMLDVGHGRAEAHGALVTALFGDDLPP